MSNELTTTKTETALSTAEELTKTARANQVLNTYSNDIEMDGRIPTLSKEIPAADRKILMDRHHALAASLRGCGLSIAGREAAAAALAAMFRDGWPLYKMENPKQILAAYVHALQDFPTWAVQAICAALAKGLVDDVDPTYPPSAARIAQLCDAKIADMKAEKAKFARVLSIRDIRAAPVSDEERARALQRYEDWKRERRPDPDEVAREEAARETSRARTLRLNEEFMLRDYRMAGREPIRDAAGRLVSLSLAKQLGLRPQPPKAEMDR